MIITSKYLNKPITIFEDKKNLLMYAPVTLAPPQPQINTDVLQQGMDTLSTIGSYITNPTLILCDLWNLIHTVSYPILLTVAMFSLLMYMSGNKNFAKYVPSSFVIFALIQAIGRF